MSSFTKTTRSNVQFNVTTNEIGNDSIVLSQLNDVSFGLGMPDEQPGLALSVGDPNNAPENVRMLTADTSVYLGNDISSNYALFEEFGQDVTGMFARYNNVGLKNQLTANGITLQNTDADGNNGYFNVGNKLINMYTKDSNNTVLSSIDLSSVGVIMTGGVDVIGTSSFRNAVDVSGGFTVNDIGLTVTDGGLDVTGTSSFRNAVDVSGGLTVNDNGINVTGTSSFRNAVDVSGGLTVNDNGINVTGTSSFRNAVDVSGGLTVNDNGINVTGISTFSNDLTVGPTGSANFNGGVNVASGLTVSTGGVNIEGLGLAVKAGGADISGDIRLTSSDGSKSLVITNSSFELNGYSFPTGNGDNTRISNDTNEVIVDTSGGLRIVDTNFDICGFTTLTTISGLSVTNNAGFGGQTQFSDSVTVLGGGATISDGLTINNGGILINGGALRVSLNGIEIAGDSLFSNDLTINGNLTVAGNTTTTVANELDICDNIIRLNYGGAIRDTGIIFDKVTDGSANVVDGTDVSAAAFFFDSAPGSGGFVLGYVSSANAEGSIGDTSGGRFELVNVSGDLMDRYCDLIVRNVTAKEVSQVSDISLKKDIEEFDNGLDIINRMRPVKYHWNSENEHNEKQYGFIAQELETVVPSIVNSTGEVKSVAYPKITSILVQAIKEQQSQINQLKSRL
jgi:hypothetical protein